MHVKGFWCKYNYSQKTTLTKSFMRTKSIILKYCPFPYNNYLKCIKTMCIAVLGVSHRFLYAILYVKYTNAK